MDFLEIANNVAVKVRLPELTTCFSSSDRNAKAIKLSIIDSAERDVFRRFDWSFLCKLATFITVDGTGDYALPADYNRSLVDTFWNNTAQRQVVGPVDQSTWALYQNDAFGVSAIDYVCNILPVDGVNRIHLIPEPGGAETITYYYVSDRYVKTGSSLVSAFTGDGDETLFDDELVEAGALYRTLRILGLDYGEEKYEFTSLRKERMSHDGGARVLNMAYRHGGRSLNADNILGVNVPLTGMGE